MPLQQPTPEKQEALPTPEPLPQETQKPIMPKGDKYTMQTPIEEIRALLIADGLKQQQGNEVSVMKILTSYCLGIRATES